MAEPVALDTLKAALAGVRGWAKEVALDGPWPALPGEDGSNWKVDVYPTKRPSVTPCTAVVDAVEAIRKRMPVVIWD